MNINPDLVRTRCQEIHDSLQRLERIARQSREQFLQDSDSQDIACYRLLVAIEAAIALCYHITARQLQKVPEEYAECFGMLGEAGVIRPELSEKLQRMARFRNLLVHLYWKLDYGMVYEILRNEVGDLREFCKQIAALL